MNYLEKLDWDMYLNELSTVWGPTYTEGLGQTAPVAPPVSSTVCGTPIFETSGTYNVSVSVGAYPLHNTTFLNGMISCTYLHHVWITSSHELGMTLLPHVSIQRPTLGDSTDGTNI